MGECLSSQAAEASSWLAIEFLECVGYIRDYPVERLYRGTKKAKIYEG